MEQQEQQGSENTESIPLQYHESSQLPTNLATLAGEFLNPKDPEGNDNNYQVKMEIERERGEEFKQSNAPEDSTTQTVNIAEPATQEGQDLASLVLKEEEQDLTKIYDKKQNYFHRGLEYSYNARYKDTFYYRCVKRSCKGIF